jgi:hypothetical protein
MSKKENEVENQEYYLATRDTSKAFLVYTSEVFRLDEIDILNLIKILVVEERSKKLGNKVLAFYRDCSKHRIEEAKEKLKLMGIAEEHDTKPSRTKAKTI